MHSQTTSKSTLNIAVTSSHIDSRLAEGTFTKLDLSNLVFEGNIFSDGIASGAVGGGSSGTSRTGELQLKGNSFAGIVQREAFKISVTGKATISHNSFGFVRTGILVMMIQQPR